MLGSLQIFRSPSVTSSCLLSLNMSDLADSHMCTLRLFFGVLCQFGSVNQQVYPLAADCFLHYGLVDEKIGHAGSR